MSSIRRYIPIQNAGNQHNTMIMYTSFLFTAPIKLTSSYISFNIQPKTYFIYHKIYKECITDEVYSFLVGTFFRTGKQKEMENYR